MSLVQENGQPRSPLDDIEGLETVPQEQMKAFEERLRPRIEEAHTRMRESAELANELRKKPIS